MILEHWTGEMKSSWWMWMMNQGQQLQDNQMRERREEYIIYL